jgi:hypothetical protein
MTACRWKELYCTVSLVLYCVCLCCTVFLVLYCVCLCCAVSACVVLCLLVLYGVCLCCAVSACVVLCALAMYCVYLWCTCCYPNWDFSVLFPQLYGKCQGITRKDRARPRLPKLGIFYCYVCLILWLLCMFRSLYSAYRLCVNVYCTAAIGCQPVYCLCVNVYCTAATGCQPVYCLCVNVYSTAATGCQPVYCLCVNVYSTAATGCLPSCS